MGTRREKKRFFQVEAMEGRLAPAALSPGSGVFGLEPGAVIPPCEASQGLTTSQAHKASQSENSAVIEDSCSIYDPSQNPHP